MNIAELFVKLGVKGESSLGKSLKGIDNGLGKVKASSISTKVAIMGVVYGLERMMSHSTQMGAGLEKFNLVTDMSTKKLQLWQHAGRKLGIGAGEIEQSFKGLQASMEGISRGEGVPKGMVILSQAMKIDPSQMADAEYMLDKIQKFAQIASGADARFVLRSFGFSDSVIAGMRKGVFSHKEIAKAKKEAAIYSKREIKNLLKIRGIWDEIGHKMSMAMGRIVADQGLDFVKPVIALSKATIKLSEAFLIFIKNIKLLKGVTVFFSELTLVLKGFNRLINPSTPHRTKSGKERDKKNPYGQKKTIGGWESLGVQAFDTMMGVFGGAFTGKIENLGLLEALNSGGAEAAIPRQNSMYMDRNKREPQSVNNNNKTTININESSTPKETASVVMRAIQAAGRMKDGGEVA